MLLAVNFHYVQPEAGYPYPGIYPVTPEGLARQLAELGRHLEFVGGQDLTAAVTAGRSLPERGCVVTFDDGLQEQGTHALPVLERLGIPAIFFVCTGPLVERRALAVHKMHWLTATRPPEAFRALAQETAGRLGLTLDPDRVDEAVAARQYLYDTAPARRLKFFLNHVLPFETFAWLTDAMFAEVAEEDAFCRDWYMTPEQVAALAREHTVGSHAHRHSPLAALTPGARREELVRSRRLLEELTGVPVTLVSYPYGGPTAVSRALAESAAACGYAAGFSMERSLNWSLADPLLLARLSTNDAPGGRSPLLRFDEERVEVQPPMTVSRRVYGAKQPESGVRLGAGVAG